MDTFEKFGEVIIKNFQKGSNILPPILSHDYVEIPCVEKEKSDVVIHLEDYYLGEASEKKEEIGESSQCAAEAPRKKERRKMEENEKQKKKEKAYRDGYFGAEAEFKVYNSFEKLIKASINDNLIILSNFKLSKKIIRHELEDFSDDYKERIPESEHDFIVIVKNQGVVLFEAKSSLSSKSDAVKELKKIENFTTNLLELCEISDLPIIKVACFPNSDKEPCSVKGKFVILTANAFNVRYESDDILTPNGIDWKDIDNMQQAWNLITPMLNFQCYVCEEEKFDKFQKIFVGVWSNGNVDEASLIYHISRIDKRLRTADLSQGTKGKAVTDDIERTQKKSIFNRLDVKYLTKEQKIVFEDPKYKHCIIRGKKLYK